MAGTGFRCYPDFIYRPGGYFYLQAYSLVVYDSTDNSMFLHSLYASLHLIQIHSLTGSVNGTSSVYIYDSVIYMIRCIINGDHQSVIR